MTLEIRWIDDRREPQCPADPEYPDGIDIDVSQGKPSFRTVLPYPAKRCGVYVVTCTRCGATAVITTAGRADDPRSVRISCKKDAV
jgi:hypothetical protein